VQAADAADTVKELGTEETAREATGLHKLENQSALLIAFLAMCLAITTVAGGDNEQVILQSEMKAADTFAFYQAKTIRRTSTILAKDDLELRLLAESGAWSPEAERTVREKIAFYEQEIDRYRNEPEEGTQDLLKRARELEAARDLGVRKDPNFDYAEGLFQIAIVVASVAILTKLRPLQVIAASVGVVALILMLNGFALLFELPF
jgi:hypothetical protein